jgi:hypothetical protein
VCSLNNVRLNKEVCFVENHAKLSEYRDIHIGIPDFDSSQGMGGIKLGKGKCSNSCMNVGVDEYPRRLSNGYGIKLLSG